MLKSMGDYTLNFGLGNFEPREMKGVIWGEGGEMGDGEGEGGGREEAEEEHTHT